MVVAVVAVLGCSSSAWAATTDTVTSDEDSGSGSLRDVVEKAVEGDTVVFDASLDGQTIQLTGAITIEEGVTIEGPGASKLTIDGSGEHQLFSVTGGTVSISGLTLARGHGSRTGGAIEQTGGSLSVSGITFKQDSAGEPGGSTNASGYGEGGAIYSGGGSQSLSVRGSTFTEDSAGGAGGTGSNSGSGEGGAIYYAGEGPLTVSSSTFTANSAGGDGGTGRAGNSGLGEGGAICDDGEGSLEVSGSTFTGNSAGGNGGNDVKSGSGEGGAIYYEGERSLEVSESTFTDNSAGGNGGKGDNSGYGDGGAIEAGGHGSLEVSGSTFTGNSAGGAGAEGNGSGGGFGGAISAYSGSPQSITNSTLFGNTAGGAEGSGTPSGQGFGGAIDAYGQLTVEYVTIDGNVVGSASEESAGSGIHGAASVTAKATIVSGNTGAANCDKHVEASSYSLEGPSGSEGSCGFEDLPSADPELGALADNGGPTWTQALPFTSPAVDVVPSEDCPASVDQRGEPRPDNGESFCDVGAYEFQDAAPVISSAASATFQVGSAGSFTLTASGSPVPKLSQSGALPTGVSFTDNGDGTATLSGTPAAGTGGSYTLTIKASNGVAPDASQSFTLTVQAPPTAAITTPEAGATYTVGQPVDSSFGCSEGAGGPGIASCADQDGRTSGQPLDTSTAGRHTLTVTATSKDGLRGTTSVSYTVKPAPPKPPALHVSIATKRTLLAHRHAKIKLRCQSQASSGVCRGKLILTVRERIVKHVHHHRRVTHRTIVIARGHYQIRSGQAKQITVKLTSKGRHLIKAAQHHHKRRHRPQLQVQAKATLNGGHGTHHTIILLLER